MPHIRIRNLLIGSLALILALAACGPTDTRGVPSEDTSSVTGEVTSTDSQSDSGGLSSGSSTLDNFPLTPNPLTITAVLDTERAITNADRLDPGIGYGFFEDGTTAEGIPFSLMLNGPMFNQDADGNLSMVLGTPVTVTPVLSITDLPFNQGYLAAVHIGPDGLLMEMPGTLSFKLQGVYDVSTLIGFAADGTGADFHLFPVTAYPDASNGTTTVYFDIGHFSLYGVAQATAQEIQAQLDHPPVNPDSQDDQELAPLTPILFDESLTPLPNKIQLQLGNSYNRLVKPYLSDLANVQCNRVDAAAYQFNVWQAKVLATNQSDFYQAQITNDATSLLARLTECAKVTCMSCLNNTSGNKLDSASINHLLVLAAFAGDMASVLDNTDESSYWMRLSMKCSEEAGLPPLYVSTGGDASGGEVPTVVPLVCKAGGN
jgi:hypothetical protein